MLQMIGVSHHTSSVEVREMLAFSPEQAQEAMKALRDRYPQTESVLLSTCNRVEVYLAQDTQLDRKVALKFLPPHLCHDEECRKRFKREAQAAAKLDHPNIISVYEVSEYQGRPYFAMAHVEGKSLKEFTFHFSAH